MKGDVILEELLGIADQLRRDREDAERYRALKESRCLSIVSKNGAITTISFTPEELDKAVDGKVGTRAAARLMDELNRHE